MSRLIDINFIFDNYYQDNPELRRIILIHSQMVARKALEIVDDLDLPLNRHFIYCGAMLHDIGVVKCNAPGLHALGKLPYICHGSEGRKILEENGLEELALICERHTGAGLSRNDIIKNGWPLPKRDMLPETPEEKLICYADKFFSKSGDLTKPKSLEQIKEEMAAHGPEVLARFLGLHKMFS